jgi:hypothetical protein
VGSVIAESLVKRASKGYVRAIAELRNRIEGRPVQAMELAADVKGGDCGAAPTGLESARLIWCF